MADPFFTGQKTFGGGSPVPQNPVAGGDIPPPPPQKIQVKAGTKLSVTNVVIGCVVIFFVVVGFVVLGLYYALNDPNIFASLGLSGGQIKGLLQLFAGLFFGLLFFFGFALLSLNIYRAFNSKESKIGYILIGLLGFFLVIGSIALGFYTITRINQLADDPSQLNTNNIVIPQMVMKGKSDYFDNLNGAIIAPAYITYEINRTVFNRQITSRVGADNLISASLDCGNGQVLQADFQTLTFVGQCLYTSKETYTLNLNYSYNNGIQRFDETVPAGEITFNAVIDVKIDGKPFVLNDNKSEIIVGSAPTKVQFNSQTLFTDLELPENRINWDLDGNGSIDQRDKVNFIHSYTDPQLYYVYYNLPGLSTDFYGFAVRVQQDDRASCTVGAYQKQGLNYVISGQINDVNLIPKEYVLDVIDIEKDSSIKKGKTVKGYFNHTFVNYARYKVVMDFVTMDGQKGHCESEPFSAGQTNYKLGDIIYYRAPNDKDFIQMPTKGTNYRSGDLIMIDQLPTTIRIEVKSLSPQDADVTTRVSYLGEDIETPDGKIFDVKIEDEEDQKVMLTLIKNGDNVLTKTYTIKTQRRPIVAMIRADKQVGEDPMTVQLDASLSQINIPGDEAVFFSWDFGDGQTMKNVNNGKVTHVYYFDREKQDGTYYPKVTVRTKKGNEDTVTITDPIIVKRKQREPKILIESHPTQIALPGDSVKMSVQTDGEVKQVDWDFGNGKKFGCENRGCIEAASTYEESGNYTIKATVEYIDYPAITTTINLKVQ